MNRGRRQQGGRLDRARAGAQRFQREHPDLIRYGAVSAAALFVIVCIATGYYYVTMSRMIDARLLGEHDRVLPRIFARPLEIRRGEGLSQKELIDRLNDLGYAQRTQAQNPGEFAVVGWLVTIVSRTGAESGEIVTLCFQQPGPPRRCRAPVPMA